MKIADILSEDATVGATSVASIGKVEYQAWPDLIKLYKRDDSNVPKNIAKIQRNRGQGWTWNVTEEWTNMKLPHFGHVANIRIPLNGKKTISTNLAAMFKEWGIKVDDFSSLSEQKPENTDNQ